ncbi:hypothetical protein F4809DRAFT_656870 [Biscogniauxia mediterranea]|nr:hypothetical protein F4809DRAFT_656870 [Biscogniauxia mediterranea]
MAATPKNSGGKGKGLPPASGSLRSVSEPQVASSSSKSATSLTPRGRAVLFTSFDEAHQNITSRLGPGNPLQESSASPLSNADNSHSNWQFGQPIIDPTASTSQNAAPTYAATSTTGSSQSLRRRHSITAIIPLIDFSSNTQKSGMAGKQPGDTSDHKVSDVNNQHTDNSAGTAEQIYDQYGNSGPDQVSSSIDSSSHGYTFTALSRPLEFDPFCRQGAATRCGFRGEEFRGPQRKLHETAIQEARLSAKLSSFMSEADFVQNRPQANHAALQPPQTSLPKAPPAHMKSFSTLARDEDSSPPPNSSISDSQHLLDADAQVRKLQQVRHDLMPAPLRLPSNGGFQGHSHAKHNKFRNEDASTVANNTSESTGDPFQYDNHGYHKFLHHSMERDVSQALRKASKGVGAPSGPYVAGTEKSSGRMTVAKPSASTFDVSPTKHVKLEEEFFDPDALRATVAGERRVRDIKIVIDRRPQNEFDNGSPYARASNSNHLKASANDVHGRPLKDGTSEGDWVTETTSEFGSVSYYGGPTNKLFGGGVKATGSSIADYSDDITDNLHGHFGAQDHIIQHPTGGGQYDSYGIRRLKDTKQPVAFPKRTNGFPENSIRLYSSKQKDEPSSFRPSLGRKLSNPFSNHRRGNAINRLSFGFERKTSSKYEFRDSTSEYGIAGASNKATCGTYESLGSPLPATGEENYQSTTDARFDRSAEYEADRNPSARTSAFQDVPITPERGYDNERSDTPFPSAYGSRQPQDLCKKQFAAATSSRWDDEPSSVNSKFEFELLPLNLAQQKHKRERNSKDTDETDPGAKSGKNAPKSSPLQPPFPAHVRRAQLARNLSSDFTPPSIHSFQDDLQDTPTPLMATAKNQFSPISSARKLFHPAGSTLASPTTPSTYYGRTPKTPQSGWFKQDKSRLLPVARVSGQRTTARTHRGSREQNPFLGTNELSPFAAVSRRKCWFYVMAVLSILPFFAVLVLTGVFDESLSWFTQGEYNRLSRKQRMFIKWMFLVECVVYTACLTAILVYYVMKSKTSS